MIEVRELTKVYGQHVAVDGVSFTVKRGETLGLLGPNGAGKTTIMRMVTGYIPPSGGSVAIDGRDMYDQPEEVKARIGYLPEHPPLYLDMTVREYLAFAARIRGVRGAEVGRRVEETAALCGLADKLGRLTGNLSKGYRQRVGLAQALVHDPDILVLDEPTVGLDPRQIVEIRELIRGLGQNRTVVLSSHILQEVSSLCGSVVIINAGRLVAFDTIAKLSAGLGGGAGQRVIARVAVEGRVDMARLRALEGVEAAEWSAPGVLVITSAPGCDVREALAAALVEGGAGLREMRETGMSLEEIFLRAITSPVGAAQAAGKE